MEKRFGVISADGHCRLMHLPFDLWTKRLPGSSRTTGREWCRDRTAPASGSWKDALEWRGLEWRGQGSRLLLCAGRGGGGA